MIDTEKVGRPKNCFAGGDGMGARRRRGGGGPEMGFRAGAFVLCKDGCCHQRRRNTNFGLEKIFPRNNFPPRMCSQNDQRDVGIILSHVCWASPPPPGTAGRAAQPQPPSRHGDQGGGGGGWANGLPCHPPPREAIFLSPCFFACGGVANATYVIVGAEPTIESARGRETWAETGTVAITTIAVQTETVSVTML